MRGAEAVWACAHSWCPESRAPRHDVMWAHSGDFFFFNRVLYSFQLSPSRLRFTGGKGHLISFVLKERNNPHLDALAVGRVERRGRVLEARVQRECGGDSSRSRSATERRALSPRRRAERLMVRCKVAAVRVPAFDEHLIRVRLELGLVLGIGDPKPKPKPGPNPNPKHLMRTASSRVSLG